MGTIIGELFFIICAVPFLTGLLLFVVPLGKVITQPSFKARFILLGSSDLSSLLIDSPESLQLL